MGVSALLAAFHGASSTMDRWRCGGMNHENVLSETPFCRTIHGEAGQPYILSYVAEQLVANGGTQMMPR